MAEEGPLDEDLAELESRPGIAKLIRTVEGLENRPCARCGAVVCGHEGVMNVVLGLEAAPRCASCIAASLGRALDEMLADLSQMIARRRCTSAAWRWATRREGQGEGVRPACPRALGKTRA